MPKAKQRRWEYKQLKVPHINVPMFNALGKDGWELVVCINHWPEEAPWEGAKADVAGRFPCWLLYFKREII